MAWAISKVLNYTNLSHPCPYNENIIIKINNISVDAIQIEPLLPAGRYRIDINLTKISHTYDPKYIYGMYSMYGSVSDNRIEQV